MIYYIIYTNHIISCLFKSYIIYIIWYYILLWFFLFIYVFLFYIFWYFFILYYCMDFLLYCFYYIIFFFILYYYIFLLYFIFLLCFQLYYTIFLCYIYYIISYCVVFYLIMWQNDDRDLPIIGRKTNNIGSMSAVLWPGSTRQFKSAALRWIPRMVLMDRRPLYPWRSAICSWALGHYAISSWKMVAMSMMLSRRFWLTSRHTSLSTCRRASWKSVMPHKRICSSVWSR